MAKNLLKCGTFHKKILMRAGNNGGISKYEWHNEKFYHEKYQVLNWTTTWKDKWTDIPVKNELPS